MRRWTNGRRATVLAGLSLLAAFALAGCQGGGHGAATADKPAATAAARWLCPMHPTYTSDHQGSCPICGMDLVEASTFASAQDGAAGGVPGLAALELDDHAVQLAGVRTQAAAIMPFTRSIRAVGIVNVDQGKLHSVQSRVGGWIETLAVDAVGARVSRGAPLLTVYSPELVATQEELLRARALAAATTDPGAREGAQALADAARRRLKLQGVGEEFIAKLEQSGKVARAVPLASPAGGVVNGMGQPGAEDVPSLPWIIRHQVTQHPLVKVLRLELDAGEAEALACALELKADLILLDERRARDVAQRLGLRFVGLLGVLIEAQRQNRLHRIRPVLDDLRQNAGFWITDALYQRVLAAAGE